MDDRRRTVTDAASVVGDFVLERSGDKLRHVIVIASWDDEHPEVDDTMLSVVGRPDQVDAIHVLDALLTHAKIATESLGGTMELVLPPEIEDLLKRNADR